MKNAHLRFGWPTYVKSTEKTTTSIKLRLDRFIGEVLPDPPRQAKAHLISVIGGDAQVAAISAAISLGDRFMSLTSIPPVWWKPPWTLPLSSLLDSDQTHWQERGERGQ